MAVITICSDFGAQENKVSHCFPIYLPKQRYYFANKGSSSQGNGFSNGYYGCESWTCEESWAPKNWCFWTVVLEKTLESPLDCKEIQPVYPKRDQSWVFIGKTDAEAETLILWPPDAKSWLIGKDFDAGRDWGQEEKGMTEDEMAGWHHWLDGYKFEWTPGVDDGQEGLVCCDSWGRKESDMTERQNWTDGTRYHDLRFLNVELYANFFTLLFHFHQKGKIQMRKKKRFVFVF